VPRLSVIPGGLAGEPSGRPTREAGSGNLVEDLYLRHAAMVLGRCRYLLRDEEAARDATQEVFARVLRAAGELTAARSPTAYLMRTATHHCLNRLRAARAAWRDEIARMARERSERGIEPEAREMVRALLAAAPGEAREVAVLYFVDEMTQAEIAAETGRSLPTVRKRLREFLAAARAALALAMPGIALPDPEELP
jgi:RNA polymerase sigma-70 factor (ECF subfamily)